MVLNPRLRFLDLCPRAGHSGINVAPGAGIAALRLGTSTNYTTSNLASALHRDTKSSSDYHQRRAPTMFCQQLLRDRRPLQRKQDQGDPRAEALINTLAVSSEIGLGKMSRKRMRSNPSRINSQIDAATDDAIADVNSEP